MAAAAVKAVKRLRGEEGSITLEASLVVPAAFLLTVALILFAIWMLNRALAYYTAAAESGRAAFAWSHSAADVRTGAYPDGAYDGLYWRLKDDAALAGLFGWAGAESGVRVPAGGSGESGGQSLAEVKLGKTASRLAAWPEGAVSYRNQLWKREITVEGGGSILPISLPGLGGSGTGIAAAALVTEPAESIRSFDLIRYYRDRFRKQGSGQADYRRQAAAVLSERG